MRNYFIVSGTLACKFFTGRRDSIDQSCREEELDFPLVDRGIQAACHEMNCSPEHESKGTANVIVDGLIFQNLGNVLISTITTSLRSQRDIERRKFDRD